MITPKLKKNLHLEQEAHLGLAPVKTLLETEKVKSRGPYLGDEDCIVSSNEKGLAGRYAGALYELAVEAKATEAVLSDLTGLKSLMAENAELNSVIESPVYARSEQATAVMAVMEKAGANGLTIKFIGTVADNGRLFALKQIIQAFAEEVARRNGQISAEVISAISLDSQRQKVVEDTVAKLAGSKNISLEMKVDPSLLGGLVVRIGSRLFDTSVKTKLNRLEAAMKGVA